MRSFLVCAVWLVGCASSSTHLSARDPVEAPAPTATPATPASPSPASPSSPERVEPGQERGAIDPSGKHGVRGQVVRVTGDFMPPTPPGYQGEITPIACRVFVFRGKLAPVATPDEKHPALVTVVKTDAQGNYRAPLVPGTYTVVAEIDGKLYYNGLDLSGNWPSVSVGGAGFSDWRIADTSRATY